MAIFASYCVRTLSLDVMFHKKLKLNIPHFFRETFGNLSLMLLISAGLMWIISIFATQSWLGLILSSIASVVCYAITVFFIGANDYEKDLILSLIHKKS